MAPNPRLVAARLDALYAQLPRLDCQGLCADSCGPIPAGLAEQQRMERRAGVALGTTDHRALVDGTLECGLECTMLRDGRCTAYDVRPMICRLWGVAEPMRCPYGCRPDGGLLSLEEGYAFLAEAYDIAGWPPGLQRYAKEEIAELARHPDLRAAVIAAIRPPTLAGRRGSLSPSVIERGYRL